MFGIAALRFTPNGQALLTSGLDGSVRMWDLKTGKHLRCYEAKYGLIYGPIDISPDGRTIAAVTTGALSIWDALTGKLLRPIAPQKAQKFNGVSFSPDGQTIVTSGTDLAARLWDLKTGTLKGVMRHPAPINGVAFSPRDPRAVTAMGDPDQPGGSPRPENAAWVWDVNHKNVALAARAESLMTDAAALGEQGKLQEAAAKFRQAAGLNPDRGYAIPTTNLLSDVCWAGALSGRPSQVLSFCDQAVSTGPDDVYAHDGRGVARALAGNTRGAVEDFTFVIDHWNTLQLSSPTGADTRAAWIKALQAGKNPFDAATLESLNGYWDSTL